MEAVVVLIGLLFGIAFWSMLFPSSTKPPSPKSKEEELGAAVLKVLKAIKEPYKE